jgi:hypothetical protein
MSSKQDKFLYEEIEFTIRNSIPSISRNIHRNLNESSILNNLGLFAKEYHNRILDAAHRLNISANMSAKKDSRRIRDELLTSHYAQELNTSQKNVRNIMRLPSSDPERISFENKIRTIGRVNPNIGGMQKASSATLAKYHNKVADSFLTLTTPRTPLQKANIYRYIRKNPGVRNAIIP